MAITFPPIVIFVSKSALNLRGVMDGGGEWAIFIGEKGEPFSSSPTMDERTEPERRPHRRGAGRKV